jgi:hypothetical protein
MQLHYKKYKTSSVSLVSKYAPFLFFHIEFVRDYYIT